MPRRVVLSFITLMVMALLSGCLGGNSGPDQSGYVISGVVMDEHGVGVEGVNLIISGGSPVLAISGERGKWDASGLNGTVTVTPQKEGWEFDPTSRVVSSRTDNVHFTGTKASALDPNVVILEGQEWSSAFRERTGILRLKNTGGDGYFKIAVYRDSVFLAETEAFDVKAGWSDEIQLAVDIGSSSSRSLTWRILVRPAGSIQYRLSFETNDLEGAGKSTPSVAVESAVDMTLREFEAKLSRYELASLKHSFHDEFLVRVTGYSGGRYITSSHNEIASVFQAVCPDQCVGDDFTWTFDGRFLQLPDGRIEFQGNQIRRSRDGSITSESRGSVRIVFVDAAGQWRIHRFEEIRPYGFSQDWP